MEEPGGARPRVTFFPPPQSRELSRPCCFVDSDTEVGGQGLHSSLPSSASRNGRHALLLLEKKVKHFEEAKKKTERFYKHLEQQFLKEQERKMVRWKKASERFEKSLEVFSRRGGKSSVPATGGSSAGTGIPPQHADPEGIGKHA